MGLRTQKTCKDSPKPKELTIWVLPETAKERTEQQQLPAKPTKEILSSEEEQILKQRNKYELITKFPGGNTKLFAKNWKKLTSDKYILDIVTNGLRLDFKEIPENRQYQFRTLKNDELDLVKAEVDKLLSKQVICKSRRERNDYLSNVFTRNKKDDEKHMI